MVTWTIELLSRLRLVNMRLHCIYKKLEIRLKGKMEKQADLGERRP